MAIVHESDIILKNESGAYSTPALVYGDGDTKIYESADDVLDLYVAGVIHTRFNASSLDHYLTLKSNHFEEHTSAHGIIFDNTVARGDGAGGGTPQLKISNTDTTDWSWNTDLQIVRNSLIGFAIETRYHGSTLYCTDISSVSSPWLRFYGNGAKDSTGRIDFNAYQIFFQGDPYFSSDLHISRSGDATSIPTQKDSYAVRFQNSFWDGGAGAADGWGIKSTASTTESRHSSLTFHSCQDSDAVRMSLTSDGNLIVDKNIIANQQHTNIITIGSASGYTDYPGIWFGSATPSITNFCFLADVGASMSIVNAPSGGSIEFRIGNGTGGRVVIGNGGILYTDHIGEYTSSHGVSIANVVYITGLSGDETETYLVAIDNSTGLLSKRSVVSIGGGVTPTDDILDWSTDKYTPYSTQQAGGKFDNSSTNPIHDTRLNYDGIFYVSRIIGVGYGTDYGVAGFGLGTTSGTGVYGESANAYAMTANQGGTLTAHNNHPTFFITRGLTGGSYDITGPVIKIFDNASTSGTYNGAIIYAEVNGYERIRMNPRITDGSSAIAYIFDTHNALSTTGAKLVSFENQGVEKLYIDKDGYIAVPNGIVRHLTISSGNALGAAGTDAGSLYLKAGDAIGADSNSAFGCVYIIPGNGYTSGVISTVYIGGPLYATGSIVLQSTGLSDNVNFLIRAKGSGAIQIGDNSSNSVSIYSPTNLYLYSAATTFGSACDSLIKGSGGIDIHNDGYDLSIKGGTAYTGNNNGGNVYIYGGDPTGSGTRGGLYFGDGSSIACLPTRGTETNVVYYDTTTGKLSYGVSNPGDILPAANDTYYLGKNSISTPLAWKGLIVKDTTNGNYYRITSVNGVITITQIT